MAVRRASHAGSWYDASAPRLCASLSSWLADAGRVGVLPNSSPVLAGIIAPHAGYSYSGRAAAHAYGAIDPEQYTRVVVLGPSHHVHVPQQAMLTSCDVLETPLGRLGVDKAMIDELIREDDGPSGRPLFEKMEQHIDEDEHSIEMHLPYLRQVFGTDAEPGGRVTFLPVMVGSLNEQSERAMGAVFAKWLGDGETLFVVSTDFCHWGQRFGYWPVDSGEGEIWESIERLDRRGMEAVEKACRAPFAEYIAETQNTVCGRFPIGVLLSTVEAAAQRTFDIKFVHYEQSSKCKTTRDSSVSYASAHLYVSNM